MFGGKGMGGGGGGGCGGGNMLRTVSRAVTRAGVAGGTGFQETLSSSSSSTTSPSPTSRPAQKPTFFNNLSVSSYNNNNNNNNNSNPVSAFSGVQTWPVMSQSDKFEWVSVGDYDEEDEKANGYFEDFVSGSVPSMDEVEDAVSALHQVFGPISYPQLGRDNPIDSERNATADQVGLKHRVSSVGTEFDWVEPSFQLFDSRMPQGADRVYDAFHLLQTEPSIQRMVISLSSDKSVWDAVLNNEVVQELKASLNAGEENGYQSRAVTANDPNNASGDGTSVVKWILDNIQAKFAEVIEKIMKLVKDLFQPGNEDKTTKGVNGHFEEKLRTSFMLSVLVLLVVVVTRASRA